MTSAVAAARYNIELESWGEAGWQAVGRVCAWSKTMGFKDAPC